jgi:uncharacterized SAM-binding protein YcdF (DUF218 family)
VRLIRRHPVLTVIGSLVLVIVLAVTASAVVVWRAAHHDGASDVDRADAIIVLGAAQYDGEPSPVFRGRLDHAVLLWEQGRADHIVTVGGKRPGDRTTEAEAGRDYLVARGVPSASVIALPTGRTTFESLQAAADRLREDGDGSAFLVSDPWHNARIESMASDLGITGYASATWTSGATTEESRSQGYLRETFAYLHYRLLGT